MAREGVKLYHNIRRPRSAREIKKSTALTMTELAGTIRRGKYTLLIRRDSAIREFELSCIALAKYCHGSIAENTRMG